MNVIKCVLVCGKYAFNTRDFWLEDVSVEGEAVGCFTRLWGILDDGTKSKRSMDFTKIIMTNNV